MVTITLDCGCSFKENKHGKPIVDLDSLSLTCPKTWKMLSEGNTKGVFQLESQLGQSLAAQTNPSHMEELSDLIAIMRPGCLEAIVDKKSLTQHYIDRKHGRDPISYLHPALEPILNTTYGIMIYQEEALGIARQIAGYSLQEAEILRKAIGKKKIELMAQVKTEFLAKAKAYGIINDAETDEIFGWIEKSQRYSFNKSHSVSYAQTGYWTAFIKAHFPREFFTAWLRHAKGKPEPHIEVQDLVNNARVMDIDILPPSVLFLNTSCKLIDNNPVFGLSDIKWVGQSIADSFRGKVRNEKYDLSTFSWDTFLMKLGRYIKKNSFIAMIKAGALDCYGVQRQKMLYDFELYLDLRKSDMTYLEKREFKTFKEGAQSILTDKIPNERRTAYTDKFKETFRGIVSALEKPAYELIDSPSWKAKQEREHLGIALTCTEVDEYDTSQSNCTCREYVKGFNSQSICLAVKIVDVREWKIKNGKSKGKTMAFIKADDGTCSLDSVTAFSEEWEKYGRLLKPGGVVYLRGQRDKNRGSFLIKKVSKLN